jgi:hypothetical protein
MERVQLNGADIEYDVRGSGAPVIFIHGAILSDAFVPVIEQNGSCVAATRPGTDMRGIISGRYAALHSPATHR